MNNDLIEPLQELEYMLREEVVFSESEKSEIRNICEQILNHVG